jgi:CRP-like cAMP-binding protein
MIGKLQRTESATPKFQHLRRLGKNADYRCSIRAGDFFDEPARDQLPPCDVRLRRLLSVPSGARRVEGDALLKAREGQVVGESAILADTPRTADLRALTNVHLLVISGVQFRALIRQHAEIAENVIRHLVTKLEIS